MAFTCQCASVSHLGANIIQASSGYRDKSLFLLNIFKYVFTFILCACICWWDRVCRSKDVGEVRGHFARVDSLLPSTGYWGSNQDLQAWWQAFYLLSHLTGLTRVSLSMDLMKPKSSQLPYSPHTHTLPKAVSSRVPLLFKEPVVMSNLTS